MKHFGYFPVVFEGEKPVSNAPRSRILNSKDEKIQNARTLPKVYYGLHMTEGVAEYRDIDTRNGEPYRILLNSDTIKNMDKSFQGRPVYVHHVDEVDMENLQNEADGYVVRSFFNKADGKHWAEFIVVSDRGHEAIRNGWKLSNAYHIKNSGPGGTWHAVPYTKEVLAAEYEHLAIVPNPRYHESVILTPDQFKEYNENKLKELERLSNSVEEKPMFNFFKKQKVENSEGLNLEEISVVLPKTGKEIDLKTLIANADEAEEKKDEKKMANGGDLVKVGEEEMTINTLIEKYNSLSEQLDKANNASQEDKPENEATEDKPENKSEEDKPENEKEEEEKKENSENFEKLANAEDDFLKALNDVKVVDTSLDMVNRGKSRYGSKK